MQGHRARADRTAQIPKGAIDFQKVHNSLRALPTCNPATTPIRYEVTFQYGKGTPSRSFFVSDTSVVAGLFMKAKPHARKGFKDLDKLWRGKPPVPPRQKEEP